MDNNEQVHKRRVRYNGTHPRVFKEKYKELDPLKYADTIEKIKQKGNTPAGMHISIMVDEILEFLNISPTQIGLDATLGYGGHTAAMLKRLDGQGHIYALDIDNIEIVKTTNRLRELGFGEDILTVKHINFADIDKVCEAPQKFDFILADLGVSSMQIDNPERGFSFKKSGPLDLRLDPTKGVSAAQRLLTVRQDELVGMLIENADEPYAKEIAAAIISNIKNNVKIDTTTKLREIITQALKFLPASEREQITKKSCQRTFQAIRIDINTEFEVLYEFLEKLPNVLAKNGRVAVLTFHSGEDRLVKKAFKAMHNAGIYSEIAQNVIRPSAEECAANPRAHSTKMRWAIKA